MLKGTCPNKSHPNWTKFTEASNGSDTVAHALWVKFNGDFDAFVESQKQSINSKFLNKHTDITDSIENTNAFEYISNIANKFELETLINIEDGTFIDITDNPQVELLINHFNTKKGDNYIEVVKNGDKLFAVVNLDTVYGDNKTLSSLNSSEPSVIVKANLQTVEEADGSNALELAKYLIEDGDISMSDKMLLALIIQNYLELLRTWNIVAVETNGNNDVMASFRTKTITLNKEGLSKVATRTAFISKLVEDIMHVAVESNLESSPELVKELNRITGKAKLEFVNKFLIDSQGSKSLLNQMLGIIDGHTYNNFFEVISDFYLAFRGINDANQYKNYKMWHLANYIVFGSQRHASITNKEIEKFSNLISFEQKHRTMLYALQDNTEFAYHVTKSKSLQEFLNKIPSGKNTLLGRLFKWLSNALNINKIYKGLVYSDSLLEDALITSFASVTKEGILNNKLLEASLQKTNNETRAEKSASTTKTKSSILGFTATTAVLTGGVAGLAYLERNYNIQIIRSIFKAFTRIGNYILPKGVMKRVIEGDVMDLLGAKKTTADNIATKLGGLVKLYTETQLNAIKALNKAEARYAEVISLIVSMPASAAKNTLIRERDKLKNTDIPTLNSAVIRATIKKDKIEQLVTDLRADLVSNLDELIMLADSVLKELFYDNRLIPGIINNNVDYSKYKQLLTNLIAITGYIKDNPTSLVQQNGLVLNTLPPNTLKGIRDKYSQLELALQDIKKQLPRLAKTDLVGYGFAQMFEKLLVQNSLDLKKLDSTHLGNKEISWFNKAFLIFQRPGNGVVQLAGLLADSVNDMIKHDYRDAIADFKAVSTEFVAKYRSQKVAMFDMFRQSKTMSARDIGLITKFDTTNEYRISPDGLSYAYRPKRLNSSTPNVPFTVGNNAATLQELKDSTNFGKTVVTNRLINLVSQEYYDKRRELVEAYNEAKKQANLAHQIALRTNPNAKKPKGVNHPAYQHMIDYAAYLADSVDFIEGAAKSLFGNPSNTVQSALTSKEAEEKYKEWQVQKKALELAYANKIHKLTNGPVANRNYLLAIDLQLELDQKLASMDIEEFVRIMDKIRNSKTVNGKRNITTNQALFVINFKGWRFLSQEVNESFLRANNLTDSKFDDLMARGQNSVEFRYYQEMIKLKALNESKLPVQYDTKGNRLGRYNLFETAVDISEQIWNNPVLKEQGFLGKFFSNATDSIISNFTSNINEKADEMFDPITGESFMSLYLPVQSGTDSLDGFSRDMSHVMDMQTKLASSYQHKSKVEALMNGLVDTLETYRDGNKQKLDNAVAKIKEQTAAFLYNKKRDDHFARDIKSSFRVLLTRDEKRYDKLMSQYDDLETARTKEAAYQLQLTVQNWTYHDSLQAKQDKIANSINGIGRNVTAEALLDTLTSYTRALGLGWRATSAMFDLIFGQNSMWRHYQKNQTPAQKLLGTFTEASLSRSFGLAFLTIMRETGSVVGQIAHKDDAFSSKLNFLVELFDVSEHTAITMSQNKTKFITNREAITDYIVRGSFIYPMQQFSGKLNVYSTMIHHLRTTPHRYGGTLFDLTEADFMAMPETERIKIKLDIHNLINEIHGASINKYTSISATAYGRALMCFRSWMPAAIETMYAGESYDVLGDRTYKGYATSVGKVIMNPRTFSNFNQAIFSPTSDANFISTRMNITNGIPDSKVDEQDIANLRRFMNQFIGIAMLTLIGGFFGKKDDEEDDYEDILIANSTQRLLRDFSWLNDPSEGVKLVNRNVIPPLSTVDQVIQYKNMLKAYGYDEGDKNPILKTGTYAGYDRRLIYGLKLIPLVSGTMGSVTYGKKRHSETSGRY